MLLLLLVGTGSAATEPEPAPNRLLIQEPDTVLTLSTQLFGDGDELP